MNPTEFAEPAVDTEVGTVDVTRPVVVAKKLNGCSHIVGTPETSDWDDVGAPCPMLGHFQNFVRARIDVTG